MGLSFESSFVKSGYGSNVHQFRKGNDLYVAQPLNQALGRGVDFQDTLNKFFRGAVQR